MTSGHSGTGELLCHLVSLVLHSHTLCLTAMSGSTLGRRFEDAILLARQQRQAHVEFSLTFGEEQISRWTRLLQACNEDPSLADPFQEQEQGMMNINPDIRW